MTIKLKKYAAGLPIPRSGRELRPGENVWLAIKPDSIMYEMTRGISVVDDRTLDLQVMREQREGSSEYKSVRLEGKEINRAGIGTTGGLFRHRIVFEEPTLPPQAKR